jgi:aminoglycoside 3-N-acetyltransferase
VLLIGVDHTVNTSLHYAERLAGRRQFIRWALTREGVAQCPGFPGCSDGFQAIHPFIEPYIRCVPCGSAFIQAIPVSALVEVAVEQIRRNPQFLLCGREDCERCAAVRRQAT